MKKSKESPHITLTIIFIFLIFCILSITMAITGITVVMLVNMGFIDTIDSPKFIVHIIIIAFSSIVIGTIVAGIISSIPLKPINKLINGMNSLAKGEYETKIDLGETKIGKELANSFNTLSDELKNTEMLRSDFVNNFSHEFKTPIVSIRGFTKLLQKGNLSEEKKYEYLSIIADESTRLATMATNVLELTKVENQSILTDVTRYNLSEQIRNCILLLEKNWVEKGLTINAEFNEYEIYANEEMLKQMWINLIDNAVKFSIDHGEISISIFKKQDSVSVTIKNTGDEISEQDIKRIFHKFYQCDTSHSSEGIGIGLALAKRITELHSGDISVTSHSCKTEFTVVLPTQ